MAQFETAQLIEGYRESCEDRITVIREAERTVIVVADGAGGVGNGAVAAENVIREIEHIVRNCASEIEWETQLRQIDHRVGVGESTCVVIELRSDGIVGASVGDSQAWIVHDGELADLTVHQIRKPLLGSGDAKPMGFSFGPLIGVLMVATDGFSNYAKRERLPAMVAQTEFVEMPRRLLEMVRLPSGDLWDDTGIVCCRVPPPRRTRKRYTI